MPAFRRRGLVAAAVSAVLLTPMAAEAVCAGPVCVSTGSVPSLSELLDRPDTYVDPPDVGGGPGQICAYERRSEKGAPPGWSGGQPVAGLYVWQQSWEWGEANKPYWDWRGCPPLQCAMAEPLEALVTCEQSAG